MLAGQSKMNVAVSLRLLCESMMHRKPILLTGRIKGKMMTVNAVVNSIEVEDGSGKNYNVRTMSGHTIFMRLDE